MEFDYATIRDTPIVHGDDDDLHSWVYSFTGKNIPRAHVCEGHSAPFDAFSSIYFDGDPVTLILGSRGSGKSMMSGILAHMKCRFNSKYRARILGGSYQQSRQIYEALAHDVFEADLPEEVGTDRAVVKRLLEQKCDYVNQSEIRLLSASANSARGPHVPLLMLDEIDEMKPNIFAGAVGIAQGYANRGQKSQIIMTSTWHNVTGLMGQQIERAKERETPFYTFCVFEVLEHCPAERSGPNLENCPKCPIVQWCHEDMHGYGRGVPKAKRSQGHYDIDSFIQKVTLLGLPMVQADYLCRGPKSEGVWFTTFNERGNVPSRHEIESLSRAQYVPGYPVVVAIDYGVCTGAVAFQVRPGRYEDRWVDEVHIFAEYYSDGVFSEQCAIEIKAHMEKTIGEPIENMKVLMDPAASTRNPIGPVGLTQFARGGIKNIRQWPNMSGRKLESLELVDSFILAGDGRRHLFIHPTCTLTAQAFKNYARKSVNGIYLPEPKDPQHPWEEIIDSIAGGLLDKYPLGRDPDRTNRDTRKGFVRLPASRVMG